MDVIFAKILIILFLMLILYLIYSKRLFKREEYNKLSLALLIVITLFIPGVIIECKYNHLTKRKVIKLPTDLKCFVGDHRCKEGDFEIWTLVHFVIYFAIGMYIPSLYFEILIISIACELLETAIGFPAKYILDPIVNMAGYILGSQFSRNK